MTKVLVSPVGLYKNRVLKGIKHLKPDWIFLLVAKGEEGNSWTEWTNKHAKEIMEKISFFYDKQIQLVPCDFEDYRTFFSDLNNIIAEIIPKNTDSPEIWIDLTSVPEIPEVAILALAAVHRNIRLFYTRAKSPLDPNEYPAEVIDDPGGDMLELPTVRSAQITDLKTSKQGEILVMALKNGGCVEGLSTILDAIDWEREKKNYMKLGRILDDLKKYGMISVEKTNREKKVKLTLWGEMIAACLSQS
ncbi:MAG: DUF6293 family protein [Candidatus Bathyarchaeota archaeon]|nr:DUF6293 family protein [Candidatus Bathyarchaeota archaeon]